MLPTAVSALLVVASLPAVGLSIELKAPRNWIFVLADDMGIGDVTLNATMEIHPGAGNVTWLRNSPRTPHLDEMATAESSVVFRRFYAGSPVCSPTRSAMLSGRTPDRECIFSAEGCGQLPAWACADNLPFPPTVFTIAEAAKVSIYYPRGPAYLLSPRFPAPRALWALNLITPRVLLFSVGVEYEHDPYRKVASWQLLPQVPDEKQLCQRQVARVPSRRSRF